MLVEPPIGSSKAQVASGATPYSCALISSTARSMTLLTASWIGSSELPPAEASSTTSPKKANTPAETSRPRICFW